MNHKDLPVIGNNTLVSVGGISKIPAKVDTGADSSSIWASQITVTPDGQLEFCLLGPEHPLYTGEKITTTEFSVQQVRNSTGDTTIRYRITLPTQIRGRRIRVAYTLMDRSRNRFPVLIGRKTLQNKFLVDVSKVAISRPSTFNNAALNAELKVDPQKFHHKYMS